MGVDAADYDGTGRQSLIIGNFSNEMMALYSNEGTGLFIDEAPTSAIGKASLLTLTFSCFFFDFDLDGLLDIFAANGHVADDISTVQPRVKYAEPAHLFRNAGAKKFEEVTSAPAPRCSSRWSRAERPTATTTTTATSTCSSRPTTAPPGCFETTAATATTACASAPWAATSNRDAIGTRIKVDPRQRHGDVEHGQDRVELLLAERTSRSPWGWGRRTAIKAIEVTWPTGQKETISGARADEALTIQEGKGLVAHVPLRRGA